MCGIDLIRFEECGMCGVLIGVELIQYAGDVDHDVSAAEGVDLIAFPVMV